MATFGKHNALADVEGILVGHYTDTDAASGVTVAICQQGEVTAVDMRGSAAGTRETDLLAPMRCSLRPWPKKSPRWPMTEWRGPSGRRIRCSMAMRSFAWPPGSENYRKTPDFSAHPRPRQSMKSAAQRQTAYQEPS